MDNKRSVAKWLMVLTGLILLWTLLTSTRAADAQLYFTIFGGLAAYWTWHAKEFEPDNEDGKNYVKYTHKLVVFNSFVYAFFLPFAEARGGERVVAVANLFTVIALTSYLAIIILQDLM